MTASASSFGAEGGSGTLTIGVSRECSWAVASEAGWLAITSSREGQGDGTVSYRVAENADPIGRQAALVVGERRVDVAQQAALCRFAASPDAPGPVPAQGGEVRVDVRTHAVCTWNAASQVPWAAVSPLSGRGDGAVRVTVTANTGPARTVDVMVAGIHVSATQASSLAAPAPGPSPSPSPSPQPDPTPSPDPAPEPEPGLSIETDGRIASTAGECPVLTFSLRGLGVYTTAATRFDGLSCETVRNGLNVRVSGTLMSDGRIRADRVRVDD